MHVECCYSESFGLLCLSRGPENNASFASTLAMIRNCIFDADQRRAMMNNSTTTTNSEHVSGDVARWNSADEDNFTQVPWTLLTRFHSITIVIVIVITIIITIVIITFTITRREFSTTRHWTRLKDSAWLITSLPTFVMHKSLSRFVCVFSLLVILTTSYWNTF